LSLFEFQNILLPLNPVLRDELDRRSRLETKIGAQVSTIASMTVETLEYFRRVMRRALDNECMVERIRQEHSMRESQTLISIGINTSPAGSWSKRRAFDQMDWLSKTFITATEIQMALD
jgi:hypothetical protein